MVIYTSGSSATSPASVATVATTINTSLETTETNITNNIEEQLTNTIQQLKQEIDANEQKLDNMFNMNDPAIYEQFRSNYLSDSVRAFTEVIYTNGTYWGTFNWSYTPNYLVKTTDLMNYEIVNYSDVDKLKIRRIIYYNNTLYLYCFIHDSSLNYNFPITHIYYTSDNGETWNFIEFQKSFYDISEHNGVFVGINRSGYVYYSNGDPFNFTRIENPYPGGTRLHIK